MGLNRSDTQKKKLLTQNESCDWILYCKTSRANFCIQPAKVADIIMFGWRLVVTAQSYSNWAQTSPWRLNILSGKRCDFSKDSEEKHPRNIESLSLCPASRRSLNSAQTQTPWSPDNWNINFFFWYTVIFLLWVHSLRPLLLRWCWLVHWLFAILLHHLWRSSWACLCQRAINGHSLCDHSADVSGIRWQKDGVGLFGKFGESRHVLLSHT